MRSSIVHSEMSPSNLDNAEPTPEPPQASNSMPAFNMSPTASAKKPAARRHTMSMAGTRTLTMQSAQLEGMARNQQLVLTSRKNSFKDQNNITSVQEALDAQQLSHQSHRVNNTSQSKQLDSTGTYEDMRRYLAATRSMELDESHNPPHAEDDVSLPDDESSSLLRRES